MLATFICDVYLSMILYKSYKFEGLNESKRKLIEPSILNARREGERKDVVIKYNNNESYEKYKYSDRFHET